MGAKEALWEQLIIIVCNKILFSGRLKILSLLLNLQKEIPSYLSKQRFIMRCSSVRELKAARSFGWVLFPDKTLKCRRDAMKIQDQSPVQAIKGLRRTEPGTNHLTQGIKRFMTYPNALQMMRLKCFQLKRQLFSVSLRQHIKKIKRWGTGPCLTLMWYPHKEGCGFVTCNVSRWGKSPIKLEG